MPENMNSSQIYSVGVSLPIRFTSGWNIQSNISILHAINNLTYLLADSTNNKAYINFNITQSYTLRSSFSGEISCFYQSESPFGMAILKDFGSVSSGVRKKFKDNIGVSRLTISDTFWNMNFSLRNHQQSISLEQGFRGVFSEARVAKLTFSKNFGNSNVKLLNKREAGSSYEQKRVKE